MAKFCNQFDRICTDLGCSVIYSHHHSKGAQGGKKSMDRASGSGVFARDPDAQLDMIELEITTAMRDQEVNKAVCKAVRIYLESSAAATGIHWEDIPEDSQLNQNQCIAFCENLFTNDKAWRMNVLRKQIDQAKEAAARRTAWRLEAILREFPAPAPVNVYFDYPIHVMDDSGALQDVEPETEKAPWERAKEKRKEQAKNQKKEKIEAFEMAFETISMEGDEVTAKEVAEIIGVESKTLLGWIGSAKKRIPELAKQYEKYQKENGGETYIRRK